MPLPLIPIAIGGGLALFALVKRRKVAPKKKSSEHGSSLDTGAGGASPPSPPSDFLGGQQVSDAEDAVRKLLASGGAAAAAAGSGTLAGGAAVTLAAAGFGREVTGTDAGLLAGINPVTGPSVAVGTQVGKEADLALGGDGRTGTGIVAQAGGGLSAGVLTVFGAVGFVAAVEFAVVAYLIASAVSDLNRLAYGQTGAKNDWEAQWFAAQQKFWDALRSSPTNDGVSDDALARMSWPFTDGYMHRLNTLAFNAWMSKPRGWGQEDGAHASYGKDRGYFVGDVTGTGQLIDTLPWKAAFPEFLRFVPASEVKTATRTYKPGGWELRVKGLGPVPYSRLTDPYNAYRYIGANRAEDLASGKLDLAHNFVPAAPDDPVPTVYFGYETAEREVTETYGYDPRRAEYEEEGAVFANATQYAAWMKTERGAGQSERSHFAEGRARGLFDGETARHVYVDREGRQVTQEAALFWQGRIFDWMAPGLKVGGTEPVSGGAA